MQMSIVIAKNTSLSPTMRWKAGTTRSGLFLLQQAAAVRLIYSASKATSISAVRGFRDVVIYS
jgi:hypothetical protein